MIKTFYKSINHDFTLLKGDCVELLNSFNFEFDMIFADPPYHLSNDGISFQRGKIVSVNKGAWDRSKGLEEDYQLDKRWLQACRDGGFDVWSEHLEAFVCRTMFQTVDFLPCGGGFPEGHQPIDGFRRGGDDMAAPQFGVGAADGQWRILKERFHSHIVISTRLMTWS